MMNNLQKLKLKDIKKNLFYRGFKIIKIKRKNSIQQTRNIFITFFLSFFVIGFFSILPVTSYYVTKAFKKPLEFQNSSKLNLEKIILSAQNGIPLSLDEELNNKNLFDDIFQLNEAPENSVRLSASTLNQLFKDLSYDLKKIRNNKIVKPIEISLLPKEIKKIENSKKRKDLFIKIVLPLILE